MGPVVLWKAPWSTAPETRTWVVPWVAQCTRLSLGELKGMSLRSRRGSWCSNSIHSCPQRMGMACPYFSSAGMWKAGAPEPSILLWVLLNKMSFHISRYLLHWSTSTECFSLLGCLSKRIKGTVSQPSLTQPCAMLSYPTFSASWIGQEAFMGLYFLWFVCTTKSINVLFHALLAPTPLPDTDITGLGHYCHDVVFKHPKSFPLDSCLFSPTIRLSRVLHNSGLAEPQLKVQKNKWFF